jgi:hypothetical protein
MTGTPSTSCAMAGVAPAATTADARTAAVNLPAEFFISSILLTWSFRTRTRIGD